MIGRPTMTELVLDTSVAVPLLVTSHVAHRSVNAALGDRTAALAGHALLETYAVLTRLPGDARLAPADAVRLLGLGEAPGDVAAACGFFDKRSRIGSAIGTWADDKAAWSAS